MAKSAGSKSYIKWKKERLDVLVAEDVYSPKGDFIPSEMLDTLRSFYMNAVKRGYLGGRVSSEMSWALKDMSGSNRLMEYEALVNNVLRTHPVTAIYHYDADRFSGALIFDVLQIHPLMVVHGQIVRNLYYTALNRDSKFSINKTIYCFYWTYGVIWIRIRLP